MRHVEFPPDQLCLLSKGEREKVSYKKFLDENVWTDPKWRQNEEYARVRNRLIALFDDAFERGRTGVSLADKDYEKWEPIAALRNVQISHENVRPISAFTDAAMFASSTEPEWAKEHPAAATLAEPTPAP